MIPIRDHNPSGIFPIITYLLVTLNVLVFLYMLALPQPLLEDFVSSYALIPALVVNGQSLSTVVTSMFLHGGFGHIFGNMLFLNIFGDNLEDKLGHLKYFLYYLLSGGIGAFLQILINPDSTIPNLGASGAIAGLLGGYLVLFPKNKVDILLPFAWEFNTVSVPAYTMLIYWILAQFLFGLGSITLANIGGVAYFAHIGGFLAGFLLILPFKNRFLQ